jgi:hypothetical protein
LPLEGEKEDEHGLVDDNYKSWMSEGLTPLSSDIELNQRRWMDQMK